MARKDSNGNPMGKSRGVRRSHDGTADWAGVDSEIIRSTIESAARVGGAIRFGYSRDGGAYAIGIYGDGDPYTEFVRPAENIEEFLTEVQELFNDITAQRMAGATTQKGGKSSSREMPM